MAKFSSSSQGKPGSKGVKGEMGIRGPEGRPVSLPHTCKFFVEVLRFAVLCFQGAKGRRGDPGPKGTAGKFTIEKGNKGMKGKMGDYGPPGEDCTRGDKWQNGRNTFEVSFTRSKLFF